MFGVDLCLAVAPLTGISDSAKYLTRTADRLDRLTGGLRRIPAAELYGDRREEPAAPVLPRLRRNGRRHPGGDRPLVAAGIPKYINVGGWPTDRPFVVLAPQHVEDPPGFDFSSCDGIQFGGSCNMQVQHDRGNASTGLLHDAGRGPRLHRLRGRPLQRRPGAGVRHRAVVRRLRDLGVPREVRRRPSRSRPRSRSPVMDDPATGRTTARSVRHRSGRSPAFSTTRSTRRAASSR